MGYSASRTDAEINKVWKIEERGHGQPTGSTPSADHPITIASNPQRIVVKVGDTVVADTREALTLHEANYPAVQYIPRNDVNMSFWPDQTIRAIARLRATPTTSI